MKTAVLLVNVGTPDKPKVNSVRRYLTQFLNDRRVIDIPWLLQKILVNLIIVPFRAPKSTKLYKLLWTNNGSPLLHYLLEVKHKLENILPDRYEVNRYEVFAGMRYGNPNLGNVLSQIEQGNFDGIVVIPLFPHYASSSTGTVNEYVLSRIKKWNAIPDLLFLNKFYYNTDYIKAFAKRAHEHNYKDFDFIMFSYHGLPLRQINKCHPKIDCNTCTCHIEMPDHGAWCYKAQCYDTTRLLAKELDLKPEQYVTSFQSRLSKNWLKPFSDKVIIDKAKEGTKRVLVIAPAFVADCLETEVEIGIEYAELFKENGGEELVMAKSLNDMDEWVETLKNMIVS